MGNFANGFIIEFPVGPQATIVTLCFKDADDVVYDLVTFKIKGIEYLPGEEPYFKETSNEHIDYRLDGVFVNYEQLDGSGIDVVMQNNVRLYRRSYVQFNGWAGIDTFDEFNLIFGYKIDEGDPVFSSDFLEQRADVLAYTHGFANGFSIGLYLDANPVILTLCFKDVNDVVYDFVSFRINALLPTESDVALDVDISNSVVCINTDGGLYSYIFGGDPFVWADRISLDVTGVEKIVAAVKYDNETECGTEQLFFATADYGISENTSLLPVEKEYVPDADGYVFIEFDTTENEYWASELTLLRFDAKEDVSEFGMLLEGLYFYGENDEYIRKVTFNWADIFNNDMTSAEAFSGDTVYVDFVIDKAVTTGGYTLYDFVYDTDVLTIDTANITELTGNAIAIKQVQTTDGLKIAITYNNTETISGAIIRIPVTVNRKAPDGNYLISAKFKYENSSGIITEKGYANAGVIAVERPFVNRDVNGDNKITLQDAVYLLWSIFYPEDYPVSEDVDCDMNCDGHVNISDAVYLMWHIFYPETYILY